MKKLQSRQPVNLISFNENDYGKYILVKYESYMDNGNSEWIHIGRINGKHSYEICKTISDTTSTNISINYASSHANVSFRDEVWLLSSNEAMVKLL